MKFDLAHCGAFVTLENDNDTYKVDIPLKIDLRRFLPLSNIKYLPVFAGKLELKVMFGTQGLVWCPVGPSKELMADIGNHTGIGIGSMIRTIIKSLPK